MRWILMGVKNRRDGEIVESIKGIDRTKAGIMGISGELDNKH